MHINIDNYTWKRVFKIMFNNLQDNKLIWIQYKLIHRILGVGKLLKRCPLQRLIVIGCVTQNQKQFYTYLDSVNMSKGSGIV